MDGSKGGVMHRTPWPPTSSHPTTGTSRGVARGSAAMASLQPLTTSFASLRRGACASNSLSCNDSKGVQTNLTVSISAGMRDGSGTWSRISAPPAAGEQQGSTCTGPSLGHLVIQRTVAPKSAHCLAARVTSKSDFRSFKPVLRLGFLVPSVFLSGGLVMLSKSSEVGAFCLSIVHVKPPSIDTLICTATVVAADSTTEPRGVWPTSGVINSTVLMSTILPGTTTSRLGAGDLSRTFTGMVS
mmetsp:Transcript_22029/g.48121  ORF Transcript_22029/g.48121 Transcript_22029/m.48121 type:complete len:242 (+) Transcript_22029:1436-2161(+)